MRTLLLLMLVASTAISQAQQIRGIAKDENGTPLSGATVSLMRIKDSAVIKFAVTKTDGAYNFSAVKQNDYRVMATHVGSKPAFSGKFSYGASDVDVPELKLNKMQGN